MYSIIAVITAIPILGHKNGFALEDYWSRCGNL
jgi:hypothetical protein